MEILSDTIFRGNVEIANGSKLCISEFELGNNRIHFFNGSNVVALLSPGTMATTSQIDAINTNITTINSNIKNYYLSNPEIPANCTRFYFYRGPYQTTIGAAPMLSAFPIVQVIDIDNNGCSSSRIHKFVQMDIEFKENSGYWNFIGNIADHSDIIGATEFALAIRN